ncbi:2-C-methyl-D-erythritol 2,4-cyclodiphosphate synthase [bacterium]|nr:2-C-methyl-D-erythritol 2,4-cyclodiphosphate synthase [bacterium]
MTTPPPIAVGFGYDVHPFAVDRRLVLGGVEIPCDMGLLGHSDADVLIHALCDALLGAAGLPDIGHFYPSGDPRWKDADSRVLLRDVASRLRELGWLVANVDCAVVAERPRIYPHVATMKERLAADMGVDPARVGIKATTNEKLGFIGRGEGIAAMATALLYRSVAHPTT